MRTTVDDLVTALEGLGTERLQHLVDTLEREPDVDVTVGSWRPHCPMVLAGFDPTEACGDAPEKRFAAAWDRFATPQRDRRRLRGLAWWGTRTAQPSDVRFLLRQANAVLAARLAEPRVDAGVSDAREPGAPRPVM